MIDKMTCKVEQHPFDKSCLIVTPLFGDKEPRNDNSIVEFKDNSIYEFEIEAKGQQTMRKEKVKAKYITSPDPCYVDLKDVLSLARGFNLSEESVLFHIREASRYANHIINEYNKDAYMDKMIVTRENIKEDYFELYMFVRYKALKDCVLEFYMQEVAKPSKIKNQTGDLVYEHEFDLSTLKDLLDEIEDEYEKWQEELITITADPKAVLRGRYSWNKYYPTNLSNSGFNRDVTPTGYDIYSKLSSDKCRRRIR